MTRTSLLVLECGTIYRLTTGHRLRTVQTATQDISVWESADHGASLLLICALEIFLLTYDEITTLQDRQVRDHDVSERDAAVRVSINAAIDGFDDVDARPRQLGSDDVEQVADDYLSVAARVEEGAQFLELFVAQHHAEVNQGGLECLTRDLSRWAAPTVYLLTFIALRRMNAHEHVISIPRRNILICFLFLKRAVVSALAS